MPVFITGILFNAIANDISYNISLNGIIQSKMKGLKK